MGAERRDRNKFQQAPATVDVFAQAGRKPLAGWVVDWQCAASAHLGECVERCLAVVIVIDLRQNAVAHLGQCLRVGMRVSLLRIKKAVNDRTATHSDACLWRKR
jgi:hypothetical protein